MHITSKYVFYTIARKLENDIQLVCFFEDGINFKSSAQYLFSFVLCISSVRYYYILDRLGQIIIYFLRFSRKKLLRLPLSITIVLYAEKVLAYQNFLVDRASKQQCRLLSTHWILRLYLPVELPHCTQKFQFRCFFFLCWCKFSLSCLNFRTGPGIVLLLIDSSYSIISALLFSNRQMKSSKMRFDESQLALYILCTSSDDSLLNIFLMFRI